MSQEPYKSAHRVFWIMDNCSAHRGQRAVERIRSRWPNAILVHTPIHASWLNPVEIYFSIVQRKVLTPNDFSSLAQLEQRLLDFQKHYEQTATPFQWTFTRNDLSVLLAKLQPQALAAAPETGYKYVTVIPNQGTKLDKLTCQQVRLSYCRCDCRKRACRGRRRERDRPWPARPALRILFAPGTQSFVGCCRLPTRRRAGQWVGRSYR